VFDALLEHGPSDKYQLCAITDLSWGRVTNGLGYLRDRAEGEDRLVICRRVDDLWHGARYVYSVPETYEEAAQYLDVRFKPVRTSIRRIRNTGRAAGVRFQMDDAHWQHEMQRLELDVDYLMGVEL
jgi:hypothetical protein